MTSRCCQLVAVVVFVHLSILLGCCRADDLRYDKANKEDIHAYVMLIRLRGDLYAKWKSTGKWPDDKEANQALAEHSRYWHDKLKDGQAILAGGMDGDYWDNVALIIFEANSQSQAEATVAADPAVKAYIFRAQVRPFTVHFITSKFAETVSNAATGSAVPSKLERHGSLPWASPDGKQVVFESDRDGSFKQIYVMNVDGTDVRRLTHSSTNDIDPVWTPDRKWIVFRSFQGDSAQLERIRPDGSHRHIVCTRKEIGWPRVSPDGKRVAFQSSDEAGAHTIVTMKLDGSDVQTVPTGLDRPWDPDWSPDGKRLVFAQQPPDAVNPTAQTESVYISDTTGQNRRLLGTFPGFIQLPAWSPDGTTIAYQTWTGKRGDADIVLLDIATGKFTTITHRDRPYLDETPAWLPDGRLLFQSTRDARYEIYVMNRDGSSQQRLTK